VSETLKHLLDELIHDPRGDLEAAAAVHVRTTYDETRALLIAACRRACGGSVETRSDVIGVLSARPEHARILRAIIDDDGSELSGCINVLAARALLRSARPSYDTLPAVAAPVPDLDEALFEEWTNLRRSNPHEWFYHPRRTKLSAFVLGKFIDDLRASSKHFRDAADSGALVGDVNVEMQGSGRRKALDLVIGPPCTPALPSTMDRLARGKTTEPLVTLEVKACMTAHRQSTPRLIDELVASLDVVKAMRMAAIPIVIVVVNVSEIFTNPLHLPGPNKSKMSEIERLFTRVVERVPLDSGSGRDKAYGAIGIAVVDTDNEKRLSRTTATTYVPSTHTYGVAIARAAALLERISL
jgi:hypothetical protein